jgi:hypothetical protein
MKVLQFFTVTGALAMSAIALSTASAFADEDAGITFVPSIGYQQKQLKFDQKYNATAGSGKADFDVTLPTLNVSLTTSYKRVFATLKYEQNIADGSTTADETQPMTPTYYLNIPGGKTTVDRKDMSFTLGLNVWRSLNIFVGYMQGETKLEPQIGCSFVDPELTCDPNTNPNGLSNIAFLHNYGGGVAVTGNYRQKYEEDGPYVGANYSWQIADAGALSVSVAYADMDGKYTDNASDPNHYFTGMLPFDYQGDSTGTSIGLTWTAPLGERSNYFIDIRQQKYSMDAKERSGNFPGNEVSTDETMEGITAGVQFYF